MGWELILNNGPGDGPLALDEVPEEEGLDSLCCSNRFETNSIASPWNIKEPWA
jgi:hypothetical protein